MRKNKFVTSLLLLFVLTFSITTVLSAQNTVTIKGKVVDKSAGNPLIGANVVVADENIGAATNFDGEFTLVNVPTGQHMLEVSYIGYAKKKIEINVTEDLEYKEIQLSPRSIKGQTVEISAQAKGQMSAINQQISSNAVKNVVAAEKIQELPEANAAEAVGRLPGVSLQREGGEGSKVVIRGLSPKYSNIQVGGVNLASTSHENRSTDLSMISPYMLAGIEVTKSAMPDQRADQMGGTVNFRLREAKEDPMFQVIAQGGYNSLREEFSDRKFVAMGSKRFFDNKLGVYANLDLEKRNRSANSVEVDDYQWKEEHKIARANSQNISDVSRYINRYGANLVMDYKLPEFKIKFGNTYNKIDKEVVNREYYISLSGVKENNINIKEPEIETVVNFIDISKQFNNMEITGGASHSLSINEVPEELEFGGTLEESALTGAPSHKVDPDKMQTYISKDISSMELKNIVDSKSEMIERNWAGDLNLEAEYNIMRKLGLKFKTGLKYEHKNRAYDNEELNFPINYTKQKANSLLERNYPNIPRGSGSVFAYEGFIDKDYNPGNFMAGNYELRNIPDRKMAEEAIHLLQDSLGINRGGNSEPVKFVPNFHESEKYDYHGNEDYYAAYIKPEISYGKNDQVTFIPGFRYELKQTEYTGRRGDEGVYHQYLGYKHHEKTYKRENEFLLPMFHLVLRPFKLLDIKASYTKTLARPSFNQFVPSWSLIPQSTNIEYNNYDLVPEKAENMDLSVTLYGDKIGLFSIGGFRKKIEDKIFWQKNYLLDTNDVIEHGLTEDETGKKPEELKQMGIEEYINNPHDAKIWGVEAEWQANFWFLPGLLKNIIFNGNYTHYVGEAKYPKRIPHYTWKDVGFSKVKVIESISDSSYKAPLINQPKDIFNITLGYKYKGFSIRGSVQYKTSVFTDTHFHKEMRGYTDPLTLYDFSLKQQLPIEGMQLFCNAKNISQAIESSHINQSYPDKNYDLYKNKSYYGMTIDIGLRYRF